MYPRNEVIPLQRTMPPEIQTRTDERQVDIQKTDEQSQNRATQANKLLGLTGAFWQRETYDHVVRPGELARIVSYVLENPVKAGLVEDWQQWPHTYLAP